MRRRARASPRGAPRSGREAGSQRIYLQVLDVRDLDHLDLIAAEVAPQLD